MSKRLTLAVCHKAAERNNGKCLSTEYINSKTKMEWECRKGHKFSAIYSSIHGGSWCSNKICILEKIEKTNLNRRGVKHHFQSPEMREKLRQTNLERYGTLQSAEIVRKCRKTNLAKYGVERPLQNKEIKGYLRDDAKVKWNWFHREYSNSEIWDKAKLMEMNII